MPAHGHHGGRIVVGVDGSESSKDALLWAAHQAELTGASLEAVITWEITPNSYGVAAYPYQATMTQPPSRSRRSTRRSSKSSAKAAGPT